MKLFSVAKYKHVVELYQKTNKRVEGIIDKTVILVKLFSVAKCKNVVKMNKKMNKRVKGIVVKTDCEIV